MWWLPPTRSNWKAANLGEFEIRPVAGWAAGKTRPNVSGCGLDPIRPLPMTQSPIPTRDQHL
jgi:hypothetical protein